MIRGIDVNLSCNVEMATTLSADNSLDSGFWIAGCEHSGNGALNLKIQQTPGASLKPSRKETASLRPLNTKTLADRSGTAEVEGYLFRTAPSSSWFLAFEFHGSEYWMKLLIILF